jgi:hypothetical protein
MTDFFLRTGSTGQRVRELQELLNTKLVPTPGIAVTGTFDAETLSAVKVFQQREWLIPDGFVETTTWSALKDAEAFRKILFPVTLIPQENEEQCWAACTAMITRSSLAEVTGRTPEELADERGLRNFSMANEDTLRVESDEFCYLHGLIARVLTQNLSPAGLMEILSEGPAMLELAQARSRRSREAFNSHWVVIAGIRGDNHSTGDGTVVRIYDPEPVNEGKVESQLFSDFLAGNMVHRIFWRRGG